MTVALWLLLTAAIYGAAMAVEAGWRFAVHNLIAHPLLVLAPPLGEWLHDRTGPEAP